MRQSGANFGNNDCETGVDLVIANDLRFVCELGYYGPPTPTVRRPPARQLRARSARADQAE